MYVGHAKNCKLNHSLNKTKKSFSPIGLLNKCLLLQIYDRKKENKIEKQTENFKLTNIGSLEV